MGSPVGIEGGKDRLCAKDKSNVRGTDDTLGGGLNQEGKDSCKQDTDDQGPENLRTPDQDGVSGPLGNERTEQCYDPYLNGGQPVDVTYGCELSGENDVPGHAKRTENRQEIAIVHRPGSVCAQEEKSDGGQEDTPSDPRGDRLPEDKETDQGNENNAQPREKAGIGSCCVFQGNRLESVAPKEE